MTIALRAGLHALTVTTCIVVRTGTFRRLVKLKSTQTHANHAGGTEKATMTYAGKRLFRDEVVVILFR